VPGTINAAVVNYFSSSAFASLAPETRRVRRNILERFRAEHGDKRLALLERAHIDRSSGQNRNAISGPQLPEYD
jgi:hypothetical protein